MYAFQRAITSLQKSYFDGQPVLFSDLAQELAAIITLAETTIDNFNSSFTEGMELFKPVDLEAIHSNANSQVSRFIAYIVDMAKAEALDCLGDTERP